MTTSRSSWGSRDWFLDKAESQGFDDPSAYFSHAANGYQAYRHERVRACLRRAAGRRLTGAVLDIGCGTGELLAAVSGDHDFSRMVGVDFVPPVVATAARRHPRAQFQVMALPDLAFPDASFDLVVASEVVYYLDAPGRVRAIEDIARTVKPGGWFLFTSVIGPEYFTPASARALLAGSFTIVDESVDSNALYHRLMTPFTVYASAYHHIYGGSATTHARLRAFAERYRRVLQNPVIRVAARAALGVAHLALRNRQLPRMAGKAGAGQAGTNIVMVARRPASGAAS